jgi:hypothetical protein
MLPRSETERVASELRPADASAQAQGDATAIAEAARTLFCSFNSAEVARGSLDRLPALFAPDAKVTVLSASGLETQSVPDFIRPRRALLEGGELADFREWETEGQTLLGRDIACRRCRYAKTGLRSGERFEGAGTKVLTFVRLNGVWKILELLWQDDG